MSLKFYIFGFLFVGFILSIECIPELKRRWSTGSLKDSTECRINVDKMPYKTTQPLYAQADTINRLFIVNKYGDILVSREQAIRIYCASGFNGNYPGNVLEARCDHNNKFILLNNGSHTVDFENVQCKNETLATSRLTQKRCASNKKGIIIEFGFQVGTDTWIPSVDACFDPKEKRTFWVQHKLVESSTHFQHATERPVYSGAEFFGNLKLNQIYNRHGQHEAIKKRLGQTWADKMIDLGKGTCLQRGHLSAVAEYTYGQQQRTMMNFVLVMLQWSVINQHPGNWWYLEISVRGFVSMLSIQTEAFSGTHGTLTKNGVKLYGSTELPDRMPIPAFYYKVLLDHQERKAFALVCVNDPYATQTEIADVYNLCPDVSDQVGWDFWHGQRKNAKRGYSFVCTLATFAANVTDLPVKDYLKYELLTKPASVPRQPNQSFEKYAHKPQSSSTGHSTSPQKNDHQPKQSPWGIRRTQTTNKSRSPSPSAANSVHRQQKNQPKSQTTARDIKSNHSVSRENTVQRPTSQQGNHSQSAPSSFGIRRTKSISFDRSKSFA